MASAYRILSHLFPHAVVDARKAHVSGWETSSPEPARAATRSSVRVFFRSPALVTWASVRGASGCLGQHARRQLTLFPSIIHQVLLHPSLPLLFHMVIVPTCLDLVRRLTTSAASRALDLTRRPQAALSSLRVPVDSRAVFSSSCSVCLSSFLTA